SCPPPTQWTHTTYPIELCSLTKRTRSAATTTQRPRTTRRTPNPTTPPGRRRACESVPFFFLRGSNRSAGCTESGRRLDSGGRKEPAMPVVMLNRRWPYLVLALGLGPAGLVALVLR